MPATHRFRAPAGLALLIVVGILGVLAVLAAAFVTMAQLERRASAQRLNATKALLLARSGVEDALARLTAGQAAEYGGENWDADPLRQLSAYEAAQEVFSITGAGTPANVEDCPVRHALRPSFCVLAGGNPAGSGVDGRDRGYSGFLQGDRAPRGNAYALRIEDESAKINVNGGLLDIQDRDGDLIWDHQDPDVRKDPSDPMDTGLGWNFQLARILDLLGSQPEVGVAGLGTAAIQLRPPGGWRSVGDLEAALGSPRDLSPYLTVSSWSDPKVLHPNAWVGQPPAASLPDVQMGRLGIRLEEGGRAPVNLNAATRPVLAALLQDLRGTSWHDLAAPVEFSISPAVASGITDALIAARPFRTWNEFGTFIDGLVPGVILGPHPAGPAGGAAHALPTHKWTGRNLCRADLVKANLDPNSLLNKRLPDRLTWRWIDKSDLTTWSTEGSLGPTGTFRIEAVGRLTDLDGRLLAERTAAVLTRAFALYRETTQEDFVAGRTGLDSYLSLSTDPLHRATGDSAAWNTWSGRGLAVTTYPCPPPALPGLAADFDGGIALATQDEDPASLQNCLFLNHFDDTWDADHGPARTAYVLPPDNPSLQLQTATVSTWPVTSAVPGAVEPNMLCPDGGHLEARHGAAFDVAGNVPPDLSLLPPSDHATISFWAKPLYVYLRQSILFSCTHWMDLGDGAPPPGRSQEMLIGFTGDSELWGVVAEHRHAGVDPSHERRSNVLFYPQSAPVDLSSRLPGLRWHLVTAHIDTDETSTVDDVFLYVRSALGSGAADPGTYAVYNGASEPLFTQAGAFVLGTQRVDIPTAPFPPAQGVMDEFAICDLKDNGNQAVQDAGDLHDDRFKIGRYYKGRNARFLSTRIAPADGPLRLLNAQWTAYLPWDDRLDAHVVDLINAIRTDPAGLPHDKDPRLRTSSLEVELLPGGATLAAPQTSPLRPGAPLCLTVPDFRYRVTFKPDPRDPVTGVPDALNQPVLETPWFDDITFAWQPMTGPRILAWER